MQLHECKRIIRLGLLNFAYKEFLIACSFLGMNCIHDSRHTWWAEFMLCAGFIQAGFNAKLVNVQMCIHWPLLHNCHWSHKLDVSICDSRCCLRLLVLARPHTEASYSHLGNTWLETYAPHYIQPLLLNPCLSEDVIYCIVTRLMCISVLRLGVRITTCRQ